jgi:tetratricopeptide (TPR) repeat protein
MSMPRLFLLSALLVAGTGVAGAPLDGQTPQPDESFQQLLDRYRNGDAEAAAIAFSAWPDARVDADARVPADATDAWALAALAVLHTDAGLRNDTFGRYRKGTPNFINLGSWGLESVFEVHSFTAYRLVEDLLARAKADDDARLLAFGRSWYILAVSYCLRWELDCAGGLFQKALHHFGDDPEIRLLDGSAAEALMTGRSRGFLGIQLGSIELGETSTSHGVFGAERQEAEWALRRALKLNPALVEARVRLGRTLYLLDRNEEARTELERASTDAHAERHLFATYLSGLFLGELAEHTGDLSGAIPYYRDAVASYPGAHTAAVALGQALVRTGLGETGWPAARAMFGDEGRGRAAVLDPWSIYRGAQYWQEASRIRLMREMVTQAPPRS